MTDDDDRREEPLLTYDQAEAEAIEEAMPMLRFIRNAEQKFGKELSELLLDFFGDALWDIAGAATDRYDPDNYNAQPEIYEAMLKAKIKEETK